jgi:hypothetical protein
MKYVLPAWLGFISRACRKHTGTPQVNEQAWLLQKNIWQYIYDFDNLRSVKDSKLFKLLIQPDYCLHQLLPPERNVAMKLRTRNHTSMLSICHRQLFQNSVLNRYLHEYVLSIPTKVHSHGLLSLNQCAESELTKWI